MGDDDQAEGGGRAVLDHHRSAGDRCAVGEEAGELIKAGGSLVVGIDQRGDQIDALDVDGGVVEGGDV